MKTLLIVLFIEWVISLTKCCCFFKKRNDLSFAIDFIIVLSVYSWKLFFLASNINMKRMNLVKIVWFYNNTFLYKTDIVSNKQHDWLQGQSFSILRTSVSYYINTKIVYKERRRILECTIHYEFCILRF